MQRTCIALVFTILFGAALTACDGGAGCVIDSDCADFAQVCMEQRCVPVGTIGDAGRRDGGRDRDAEAPRDAGRDAGMTTPDGGGEDASMSDGGAMPCADATGAWSISFQTSCESAMVGYGVTIATGSVACEYVATSNDPTGAPAIDGTFTLAEDGSVSGSMTPGASPGGPTACTGTLSGTTLTFVCGSCVMNLTR